MCGVEQALSDRYAETPAWRRRALVGGVVLVAALALAWLGWVIFVHSTPAVESELESYDVVDAHHVTASVQVNVHDASAHPRCTVQALATDHSIVGELVFTPRDGLNQVTVRTEREATTAIAPGCTADGQNQPR
jgi:hypothetical protein